MDWKPIVIIFEIRCATLRRLMRARFNVNANCLISNISNIREVWKELSQHAFSDAKTLQATITWKVTSHSFLCTRHTLSSPRFASRDTGLICVTANPIKNSNPIFGELKIFILYFKSIKMLSGQKICKLYKSSQLNCEKNADCFYQCCILLNYLKI